MNTEIFLPTLPHWQFKNDWSGSKKNLRFYITTSAVEDEGEQKRIEMLAEVWNEDVCRDLAKVLDSHVFPCTQEGLGEMKEWLEEKYHQFG